MNAPLEADGLASRLWDQVDLDDLSGDLMGVITGR
jgi:hypothetical protein